MSPRAIRIVGLVLVVLGVLILPAMVPVRDPQPSKPITGLIIVGLIGFGVILVWVSNMRRPQ